MKRVLNFGSINVDHVYTVEHFVRPGETILVVNETEAQSLTGEIEPETIYENLKHRYPNTAILLTMGHKGAAYFSSQVRFYQPAEKVHVVDSTGAGDAFIGFFLAELIKTNDPKIAVACATRAAALCVTRHGAADSIPNRKDLKVTQQPI